MVIRTSRTASFRRLEITESAPTDSHIIGETLIIEVTIHTIPEITVIHPGISHIFEAEQIVSIAIICTGSDKRDIANNEIVEIPKI